jgi:hypothetical protein
MQIRSVLLIVALALAPAPILAAPSPLPEYQQAQDSTPCEDAATAIAEHATSFIRRANDATVPFDIADGTAKACGVLLRGIKELRDMSCPQSLVDLVVNGHKEIQETLDAINQKYSYRFSCFVPDFL